MRCRASGHAAAAICRHAGGSAAQACVAGRDPSPATILDHGRPVPAGGPALSAWRNSAPDCVALLAERADAVFRATGAPGFTNFVAAGLKFGDRDNVRRREFFRLRKTPRHSVSCSGRLAQSLCATQSARLQLLTRGLWGRGVLLRPSLGPRRPPVTAATSRSHGVLLMPAGRFPRRAAL